MELKNVILSSHTKVDEALKYLEICLKYNPEYLERILLLQDHIASLENELEEYDWEYKND